MNESRPFGEHGGEGAASRSYLEDDVVSPDALGDDPGGVRVGEEVLTEAFLGALVFGPSQNARARLRAGGRRRCGRCG
jgi:hypothetical protein